MSTRALRILAVVSGLALWTSLAVPALLSGRSPPAGVVLALVAAAALLFGLLRPAAQRVESELLNWVLFPAALALSALVSGGAFAARVGALGRGSLGVLAVCWLASLSALENSLSPALPTRLAAAPVPAEEPQESRPLRRLVLVALGAWALAVGSVLPGALAASVPWATAMGRARHTVLGALALVLSLAVVLLAGSALVRKRSAPPRRISRAVALFVWAGALGALSYLVSRWR